MKKMIFALMTMLTLALNTNAMTYEQARREALFLTDKMAYELNLSDAQYEAAYEINLDYLMSITSYDDVAGIWWERRNEDLRYILYSWQWDAFCAASYFFRPLYWSGGYWHFSIYARYPRRDYFYFGTPHFYASYRGGHSWRANGGRSFYATRREHFRPGHVERHHHVGLRTGWDRGDYRGMSRGNSSTRVTAGGRNGERSMHISPGTNGLRGGTRDGMGNRPNGGTRQGMGNRPNGGGTHQGMGNRPNSGGTNRSYGNHSTGTNAPEGFGNRHTGTSTRQNFGNHSTGTSTREGIGNRVIGDALNNSGIRTTTTTSSRSHTQNHFGGEHSSSTTTSVRERSTSIDFGGGRSSNRGSGGSGFGSSRSSGSSSGGSHSFGGGHSGGGSHSFGGGHSGGGSRSFGGGHSGGGHGGREGGSRR